MGGIGGGKDEGRINIVFCVEFELNWDFSGNFHDFYSLTWLIFKKDDRCLDSQGGRWRGRRRGKEHGSRCGGRGKYGDFIGIGRLNHTKGRIERRG